MSAAFHLIVSDVAARDIETILEWTVENFGLDAELRYRRLITQALRDIEEEPNRLWSLDACQGCLRRRSPTICTSVGNGLARSLDG